MYDTSNDDKTKKVESDEMSGRPVQPRNGSQWKRKDGKEFVFLFGTWVLDGEVKRWHASEIKKEQVPILL